MSINIVTVSGNLTRSPELRATKSGTQILTFTVAVNDRRRDPQTGEWSDYPNFIDCSIFGKRAESLSKLLSKGGKVCVSGKLRQSSWTDKQGQKRSKVEVVAEDVELMGGSKAQGGQSGAQTDNYAGQQQSGPNSAPQQPQSGYPELYDDDMPF